MAWDEATQTVVLFGGQGAGGDLGDTWTWDGRAWSEQHPGGSPSPRSSALMAWDAALGKVVLFGGTAQSTAPATGGPWPCPLMKGAVGGAGGAATIPPGAPMAPVPGCGGFVSSTTLDDTWTWDGHTWTQQHPAHHPEAAWGAAMAYDGHSGLVLLVTPPVPAAVPLPAPADCGPVANSGGAIACRAQASTGVAGPAVIPTICAVPVSPGRPAKRQGCAVPPPVPVPTPQLTTWTWNGSDWSRSADPLPAGWGGPVQLSADGSGGVLMVLAGGPVCRPLRMAPSPGASGASMPCPALGAPGSNIMSLRPQTLRWDHGWHDMGVVPPLPWGFSGAMAGDDATRTAVHVDRGGTTFTWEGHAWTEPHPAHTPASRLSPPAMAYDAARHEVVLFGGRGWGAAVSYGASRAQGSDLLNDTWTWDGADWTLRAGTPPSPPPRPPSRPPFPTGKPVPVPQPAPVEPCAVPPPPNSGDTASGRGETTPGCTTARTPLPVQ